MDMAMPTESSSSREDTKQKSARSMPDKILVAFHHACDSKDFEVAARLLVSAEAALSSNDSLAPLKRRRAMEGLVAAHERLWVLTHTQP
jgi:hypothetical protein